MIKYMSNKKKKVILLKKKLFFFKNRDNNFFKDDLFFFFNTIQNNNLVKSNIKSNKMLFYNKWFSNLCYINFNGRVFFFNQSFFLLTVENIKIINILYKGNFLNLQWWVNTKKLFYTLEDRNKYFINKIFYLFFSLIYNLINLFNIILNKLFYLFNK